uniref:NADH-ubiquinone oxidoreductase chain 2 n=1 Tax=Pseudoniphargus gorbeanus TaxID=1688789 RepID=A0A0M6X7L2_9CRUS|nr:NADH dehydrogenase subunit 2 [Pseudoniphargus gorbeanus]
MFIHPSFFLFFSFMLLSMFMTISSNSWLFAWMGLEINLLSFIPIMLKKFNKYNTESAIKYFLVQVIASVFIIFSFLFIKSNFNIIIFLALMMKMGASPFHQWLPSISDGLSWPAILMTLVMQKLNPLILTTFMFKTEDLIFVLQVFIISSALVGSVGGLTQSSLRKIMVFSSISHLSWVLSSMLVSNWAWFNYFLLYSLILSSLIITLYKTEIMSINDLLTKNKTVYSYIISISMMSVGGLPPFSGFMPKLIVVQDLMNNNFNFIMLFLLFSTFISLFFYCRMFVSILFIKSTLNLFFTKSKKSFFLIFLNSSMLVMPGLFFINM